MITTGFLALVFAASLIAIVDWRRGWVLFALIGAIQDPVSKLTPGTPVAISFSVVAIYLAMIIGASRLLPTAFTDLKKRYRDLHGSALLLLAFVLIAAVNGLVTFGIGEWKAPALAL